MSMIDYYIITAGCIIGASYTGFQLGERSGIVKFLKFLEQKTAADNIIKIRIKDDSVEFLK